MGICGRISSAGAPPRSMDRTLATLSIGSVRWHRYWSGTNVRLASCDDAALASNTRGDSAVFDGRIDNRDELRRALNRADLDRLGNAEIALLCYERWPNDFCDRIVGDYACALWDARQDRLVMAVEPGGYRPLFYWLCADEILFASETRGLWSDPKVPKALDEDQMAAWLCMLPCHPNRSFYRDIFRVPPGYRVIWQSGLTRLERWWKPEQVPELKLASDRDYEEAMRSSFENAVRCRIGTDELIGANLSGGLDSSAVTASAARLLATQGRRLTAFTAAPAHQTPEQSDRFNDEWPLAAALAAMYPNVDHVRIGNNDAPLLDALELREAAQDGPVLNPSNTVWANGIERVARDRRISVMLIGSMGNMTISYDGGELLASQIRSGRFLNALKTIHDLRRSGSRTGLSLFAEVADTILPTRVRRGLRRAFGRAEVDLFDYSIIDPKFIRARGIDRYAHSVSGNLRNIARGNSRALRLAVFERLDRGHWAAATRRLFGVDTRDPTSDRRLTELCFSIPDNQYLHKGIYRSLVRRAMIGIVPDQILRERRKGLQAADWRHGFDAAMPSLKEELARLHHSPLARQCLDLSRMQKLLDSWSGPDDPLSASTDNYLLAFSRGIAAGHFIRRIEGGNR